MHTLPILHWPIYTLALFTLCPVYTLPHLNSHSLFNSFNHLHVPFWRNGTVHVTYTLGLMGRKVFRELLYLLMRRLRTDHVPSKSAPISALPWRSRKLKWKQSCTATDIITWQTPLGLLLTHSIIASTHSTLHAEKIHTQSFAYRENSHTEFYIPRKSTHRTLHTERTHVQNFTNSLGWEYYCIHT